MPSPDVAAYTGLTLLDTTAQTLLEQAIANLAVSFPDWIPREGNTEMVILEETALMVEDTVHALNALPDVMAEVLLRLFGLTRDQGTAPTATATFTLADDDGHTIPAGTTVRLDLGDDADPVDFTTDADLVIAPASTSGTVAITGTAIGDAGNGKPSGTPLELLDAIPYVETVALASTSGSGTVAEDGAAFLDRAVPLLSRLTTTLVRPADIEAFVIDQAVAERVKVLDLYNPAGVGEPGDDPGYVTVAVATAGGGALSAPAKAELLADLEAAMHAGLIVSVVDADVTEVDVTITVLRRTGYTDAEVEDNVTAILAAYLDPDTWDWSRLVRRNELIAQADRADGVDVVLAITVPAADLTLTGNAPLATAGTITVTVQAPA